MFRWAGALLAVGALSVFAVLLLTGDYIREGPVLVTLSATHGIHRGDLGVVAVWALGVIGVLVGVLSPRRGAHDPS
ncbi:hypothetical protein KUM42_12125 [Modestobacter sp. L9-4]|jgi:hypothetical protein|uniref:hypothetical protein n=1 Tax=Modestobacter sp. L9-4 TaxID=2851567 RepID=UPI001C765246|nr:hypothetical protein [Modestobacter sp. L9-4]QXG74634.1 hypothetical protein KUM42_12125 [Modestobacter sp. L9-4]